MNKSMSSTQRNRSEILKSLRRRGIIIALKEDEFSFIDPQNVLSSHERKIIESLREPLTIQLRKESGLFPKFEPCVSKEIIEGDKPEDHMPEYINGKPFKRGCFGLRHTCKIEFECNKAEAQSEKTISAEKRRKLKEKNGCGDCSIFEAKDKLKKLGEEREKQRKRLQAYQDKQQRYHPNYDSEGNEILNEFEVDEE